MGKVDPSYTRPMGQKAWSKRHNTRHLVFLSTIILDLGICAIATVLFLHPVTLSSDPQVALWSSRLPTLASIVGNGIAGLNGVALTLVIVSYAKRLAVNEGFTLHQLRSLTSVATGSFPFEVTALAAFALSAMLAKAFLPSALVQALTPAAMLKEYTGTVANVGFAASFYPSTGMPAIRCEYGGTYGYGFLCPINNKFGSLYDAGVQVFTNSVPENYTRFGVTYPNKLSGISGAVSYLTADLYKHSISTTGRPTTSDVVSLCVPKMNVNTTCRSSLRTGYTYSIVAQKLEVDQPRYITRFTLNGSDVTLMNTFPDYGHGSIVPFGARYPSQGGMSSVFIVASSMYQDDLGSPVIECNTTAEEKFIPIKIRGGAAVEDDSHDKRCGQADQPSSNWLPHLTFLAQMVLQKQQGQDGRLESVMLFQPNASVTMTDMLETALTRMVSAGATEMYANLYAQLSNSSSRASYPSTTFTYQTPQFTLGNSTWQSLLFLIAPFFFLIVLLSGWIFVAWSHDAALRFNPIDNVSMGVAGLTSNNPPQEVLEECAGDDDRIDARTKGLLFRFGVPRNAPLILGLYTSQNLMTPKKGELYGAVDDVSQYLHLTRRKQPVSSQTPHSGSTKTPPPQQQGFYNTPPSQTSTFFSSTPQPGTYYNTPLSPYPSYPPMYSQSYSGSPGTNHTYSGYT